MYLLISVSYKSFDAITPQTLTNSAVRYFLTCLCTLTSINYREVSQSYLNTMFLGRSLKFSMHYWSQKSIGGLWAVWGWDYHICCFLFSLTSKKPIRQGTVCELVLWGSGLCVKATLLFIRHRPIKNKLKCCVVINMSDQWLSAAVTVSTHPASCDITIATDLLLSYRWPCAWFLSPAFSPYPPVLFPQTQTLCWGMPR